jgi:hypothetical protein
MEPKLTNNGALLFFKFSNTKILPQPKIQEKVNKYNRCFLQCVDFCLVQGMFLHPAFFMLSFDGVRISKMRA